LICDSRYTHIHDGIPESNIDSVSCDQTATVSRPQEHAHNSIIYTDMPTFMNPARLPHVLTTGNSDVHSSDDVSLIQNIASPGATSLECPVIPAPSDMSNAPV
jgi:hypothetical protein